MSGHSVRLNVFELMKAMIEAGAAGVHFEDQLASEKKCGRMGGKLMAYNCSPSFNWKKQLDAAAIASFRERLVEMDYAFQFVTLAGFHSLNHSMFELALGYRDRGMAAYSELQQAEFALGRDGYTATKHQREVGTGYFDEVAQVISGGASSTTALEGSTEVAQFAA